VSISKEVTMANMGYCRFQNTLPDLQDCVDNLEDEVYVEEARARRKLIKLCLEVARMHARGDLDCVMDEEES
jgi:hypothetical protein